MSVADTLFMLANSDELDRGGASRSMDWDTNGERRRSHIRIWRFIANKRIEEVGSVAFKRLRRRFRRHLAVARIQRPTDHIRQTASRTVAAQSEFVEILHSI